MEQRSQLTMQGSERVLAVLIGNLLRNAVNYTDEGEVIALVSGHSVEIRDSGAGMRREDVERIFTPFYRGQQGAQDATNTADVESSTTLDGVAKPHDADALDRRRERAPNNRRRGGHGVGLTIVKRLSDRFGWPVQIDSAPGKGTRVIVEFPAGQVTPA